MGVEQAMMLLVLPSSFNSFGSSLVSPLEVLRMPCWTSFMCPITVVSLLGRYFATLSGVSLGQLR